MRLRITISRAIFAFGALTVVGLTAVILASNYALSELKVGGPLYSKIKLGNDLIADILPPPEYIIEAYLEATLARQDPSTVAARRDRLAQLKKEYDERHAFWTKSDLEPVNKARLVEKSHQEVQRFWSVVEQSFLPALARGDTAQATKSYSELAAAYTAHRAVIDEIVKQASDDNVAAEAEATSRVQWFTILLWGISAFVFLVVGAGIAGVAKGVIRPITRMTGAMQRLANGELDQDIPSLGRKDEVGAMASALQVFKENSLRVQAMEAAHAIAAKQAEADRKAGLLQVADGFEQAVGRIIRTVSSASSDIEAASGNLTKTAETTQELSATVAAVSEQSSSSVRSAAAASEEMAASVAEIGRQVQQSQQIALAAVAQAEQTNVRIAELSQSASRIGEVIKMITAVAEQTNLLALNATIEAARAGDAGRGFAVVASEVKALSAQTAKATEEIAAQVTQMQSATEHSVSAIKDIGATIAQISEISTAIAAAVDQQGASTQEIARNVQQAALGATQVTGRIADVNRGAADTGTAAGQVHGLAVSLLSESNHLSTEVENFLLTIRVA
ncbi:MAG: methyl-accepting chemotaxis protein [Bradyrhizobium sp.]|nr:methyl-accepting chemotaxis protein [Bradyrhizobium sp.]